MRYKLKVIEVDAFQMTEARSPDNSEWPTWLNKAWNGVGEGAMWLADGTPRRFYVGTRKGVAKLIWDDWITCDDQGHLDVLPSGDFETGYEKIPDLLSNPPKSPIEVTIRIGAETFADLWRVMYDEIKKWDRDQEVRTCFWGGSGIHGDVIVQIRDITPEQYREELWVWADWVERWES